jgi:hypothetical protein
VEWSAYVGATGNIQCWAYVLFGSSFNLLQNARTWKTELDLRWQEDLVVHETKKNAGNLDVDYC